MQCDIESYRRRTRTRVANAVSSSHQRTVRRVQEQWEELPDLEALLGRWDMRVKPSTALLWVRTLTRWKPELRNATSRRMVVVWEREAAVVTRRAVVALPAQVKRATTSSDIKIARTIEFLWSSACRHADLARADISPVAPGIYRMKWAWQKSDLRGRRYLCKFVWNPPLPPQWATYDQVYQAMKRVHADLTVHSLRRGALTYLSAQGYSHAEIGRFSLHTPQTDESLGVRRYIDPHPTQPEGRRQLQMSETLWKAINTKTASL
jgi:hypothetical protein